MSKKNTENKIKNKKMVKTIRMVKSPNGYKFTEKIISIENVDNFFNEKHI
ncbi:MAG: DUF4295 family protein [Candidatus Bostrichicola ureolyticus]|nr:MAG: DUF4295 family protein [Candidatus Bostrichicola ureolyticus]WGH27517.1 MAG: DUF4295 family protein [Candidatus Bostrichicola ureolyticus]